MSNAEVSAEYCWRALVARNLAMSPLPRHKGLSARTRTTLAFPSSQARPSNCCARIG
jgi:hypothetical protein